MSSEFGEFVEAAAGNTSRSMAASSKKYERVAILGGGSDARLFAALCLAEGAEVTLFSAYGRELEALRSASGVALRGAGPVGTYQVGRTDTPSIQLTAELDAAVGEAEVIFLTGPVHKQRTYAMVLAEHLSDGQVLVLCPGRSLGALETAWALRIGGSAADVTIVEAQGAPYWVKAEGSVLHLTQSGPSPAATLPRGRNDVIEGIKRFLPNLQACDSVLTSGFSDGSALVEFPALMMGGAAFSSGAIAVPMGGEALAENQTFASLIGPEQKALIERLSAERHAVAMKFGVRDLPSADEWIAVHAGSVKGEGRRSIPTIKEARSILRDGVLGSLVPLVSGAELAQVDVPATRSMVTLASTVLGADIASAGRRLDTIGVREADIDAARTAMDAIAAGARHG